jgi:hypothetical protein
MSSAAIPDGCCFLLMGDIWVIKWKRMETINLWILWDTIKNLKLGCITHKTNAIFEATSQHDHLGTLLNRYEAVPPTLYGGLPI